MKQPLRHMGRDRLAGSSGDNDEVLPKPSWRPNRRFSRSTRRESRKSPSLKRSSFGLFNGRLRMTPIGAPRTRRYLTRGCQWVLCSRIERFHGGARTVSRAAAAMGPRSEVALLIEGRATLRQPGSGLRPPQPGSARRGQDRPAAEPTRRRGVRRSLPLGSARLGPVEPSGRGRRRTKINVSRP
jgi:hypothetical protein